MRIPSTLSVVAAVGVAMAISSAALAAEDCKPSKWGADDELGAANYVTPKQVMAAVKLVKKGESHPLGIVISASTPAFPPRSLSLQIVQPEQQSGRFRTEFGWPAVYNDDVAQLWFGTGPQIDGLGHLGEADVYYNCNKGVDFAKITGVTKMGVDKIPPMIGRGVMIDMAKHFGAVALDGGKAFNADDVKAAPLTPQPRTTLVERRTLE